MSGAEAAVHTAQSVVVALSVVALVAAAGFTLYRLAKGPTNLDRIIASDLMVGIAVASFAVQMLLTEGETSLPVMLAISVVGFIGSVSMARFVHDRRVTGPRDLRRSRRRADTARQIVRGERPAEEQRGTAPRGEPVRLEQAEGDSTGDEGTAGGASLPGAGGGRT